MLYSIIKKAIDGAGRVDVETILDEGGEELLQAVIDNGGYIGEAVEILDRKNGREILEAALDLGIDLDTVDECYQGEWGSDEDFAQNMLEDLGDIPKDMPPYLHIDWERTAFSIMMDYSESNHHYFRNM